MGKTIRYFTDIFVSKNYSVILTLSSGSNQNTDADPAIRMNLSFNPDKTKHRSSNRWATEFFLKIHHFWNGGGGGGSESGAYSRVK
jgi:hypothetical protein